MNVTLKVCTSENNKLSKSFSGSSVSFDCVMKDNCSVFDPVILIGTTSNLTQYNYAEISDLGRKYFITDIALVRANLYQVKLHVDVLSTYESELRNVPIVAGRQEYQFNKYLIDNDYLTLNTEQITTKYFPSTGFSKDLQYVLCVAGS